ncbi:MAG: hypothetical protein ACYTBJ_20550 [Planctomycetota bacterium]|jgi:hypothetical protein
MTDLSELSAVLEKLPETERAIAMRVSLMTEGLAEHVDGAVYAVAETMRRERSD